MRIIRFNEFLNERLIVRQLMKYAITTGFSACLSFVLPIILVEIFEFSQSRAVATGFLCAYLFNMLAIRSFVFESQAHWARDLIIYIVMNGALRGLEFFVFFLLVEWLGIYYAAALFIVLAVATITKFFVYRYVLR